MGPKRYWLFKSEPDIYSIDDLAREERQTCHWDGVRNYQARNLLRDQVAAGDGVLFYHSSCPRPAVAGTCEVVEAGYPDPTQFDPKAKYFDAKSDPARPRWYVVDIRLVEKFPSPVTLAEIRETEELAGMALVRRGQRLSIQPVTSEEWRVITRRGKRKSR